VVSIVLYPVGSGRASVCLVLGPDGRRARALPRIASVAMRVAWPLLTHGQRPPRLHPGPPAIAPGPVSYMPVAANAYPMLPTIGDYRLLEETPRAILAGAADRITATEPLAGAHLRCGQPADEIAATAREIGADLVLIGSRGLGPVRRLVLGSVSGTVVQHAPCPILVTQGGAGAWPPSRVIASDDGSDDALAAIGVAATIATACEAQLTLVRAIPTPPSGSPLDPDPRGGLLGHTEAVPRDRAPGSNGSEQAVAGRRRARRRCGAAVRGGRSRLGPGADRCRTLGAAPDRTAAPGEHVDPGAARCPLLGPRGAAAVRLRHLPPACGNIGHALAEQRAAG
jgi:nucleotide-binding universal stress UspA family protein